MVLSGSGRFVPLFFSTDGHDGSPFREKSKREKESLYDDAQRTGKLRFHN